MIVPVILAGGSGSRLWPLSRQLNPKQFLRLTGENTMLQATVACLQGLDVAPPVVVCNDEHRFLVAEQLRACGVKDAQILLEPARRNTAPAIAIAAMSAAKYSPESILLVLAADHLIRDEPAFINSVLAALSFAEQGKLVTFGVKPTGPETGYGYIRAGSELGKGVAELKEFVEKPSAKVARAYLETGGYTWNSGMFMFRADRYLQELNKWRPDIFHPCELAMEQAVSDLMFLRVGEDAFQCCPEESIDYAVMEKTDSAVVVEMDAGWSDIGSWSALRDNEEKDSHGNAVQGDVVLQGAKSSLVRADHRLVALVGVEDLVVVETKDAVLVAQKDHVQGVKKVVEAIKSDGRHEHMSHREVYRPWGVYDSVDNGKRYQVKRITVKPGAKLSLQMHHHRAEHWIVVSGTAKMTNGNEHYFLAENQSTHIPVGQVHCLEHPGVIPLELIEVQSGSYLGEDDIVRLKDWYGRA